MQFAINHGFTVWQTGLSFVTVVIGMILFFFIAGPFQHRYYTKQIAKAEARGDGIVPPEARLPAMAVGAFILPTALFIFAFCSYPHVHWIGSAIGAALFGFACE
jgi:MFS family permease